PSVTAHPASINVSETHPHAADQQSIQSSDMPLKLPSEPTLQDHRGRRTVDVLAPNPFLALATGALSLQRFVCFQGRPTLIHHVDWQAEALLQLSSEAARSRRH